MRADRLRGVRTAALTSVVAFAALGAGCAVPTTPAAHPEPAKVAAPMPPSAEPGWSEFFERTRTWSADDVARAVAELSGATSPASKLQLAMLLAAPQWPSHDDARAQALADEVAATPTGSPRTRDAAYLFSQLLAEQRRSTEAGRRALARSVDDQKRIDQLDARARDAERRASDAERKLEALKQIDKALNERTAPGSGAPKP